jgi:hypothetical protein
MRRLLNSGTPRTRRRLVSAAAGLVLFVVATGGGAAYAYWTSNGSGSGAASTGQPVTVHVLQAAGTPTNKLLPGGTSDLALTLNNPNTYPVTIVGVAQNGNGPDPGSGCTFAGSAASVPTQSGLSIVVAPGAAVDVTIPGAAAMGSSSASACQGKTIQIPVTVTVQK